MRFRYRLLTQLQLCELFGVSSHKIGEWLVRCGLRDGKTKKPTTEAHQGGYCDTAPSGQTGYCWAWTPEKVVPRFVDAGHALVAELPEHLVEPPDLHGPFKLSDECSGEVLNADGSLAARTVGRQNAEIVLKLLDFADQRGVISRLAGQRRTGGASK